VTETEEQQGMHLPGNAEEAPGKTRKRLWGAVDVIIPHSFGTSFE